MKRMSREEIGLRPPKGEVLMHPDRVQGTILHYSGALSDARPDHSECDDVWRRFQNQHMAPGGLGARRGGNDIAYTDGICPHGYVLSGRPWNVAPGANGTSDCNNHHHALCILGGDVANRADVTEDAKRATKEWISEHNGIYPRGAAIGFHSDCKPTACPGNEIREWVRAGMPVFAGEAPAPPQPTPAPPPPAPSHPPWPGVYLKRGSKGGHVRTVQSRLRERRWRISVDGDFGPQTDQVVRAFQQEKRLGVDGIVGKLTWNCLYECTIT